MEVKGKLSGLERNLLEGVTNFTITTRSKEAAEELERLKNKDLRIKVVQYRQKRSLSANALLWHCIGKISEATRADKWDVYLKLLREHGKFTFVCVQPHMVDAVKSQWREAQVWNSVDINGRKAVQMICYFGSSSYNTAEMSRLIDGALEEMRDLNLDLPMEQDVRAALEQWEAINGQHNPE